MTNGSEPSPRPKRRTFPAAARARLLTEYDSLETAVERLAFLRREGLYASIISKWRGKRDRVARQNPPPAGRPARPHIEAENIQLKQEIERLKRRAEKSEALVDAMGKVSTLLQIAAAESVSEWQSSKKLL